MDMSVWYLLGAVLVFFMQCGFAMVETGFTRESDGLLYWNSRILRSWLRYYEQ